MDKIELLVGTSDQNEPMVIIKIDGIEHVLNLQEANQLGSTLLITCGVSLERGKKK